MNLFIASLLIVVAYFVGYLIGNTEGEKSIKENYNFVFKPEMKIYDTGFRRGKEEGIEIGRAMQINDDMRRKYNGKV